MKIAALLNLFPRDPLPYLHPPFDNQIFQADLGVHPDEEEQYQQELILRRHRFVVERFNAAEEIRLIFSHFTGAGNRNRWHLLPIECPAPTHSPDDSPYVVPPQRQSSRDRNRWHLLPVECPAMHSPDDSLYVVPPQRQSSRIAATPATSSPVELKPGYQHFDTPNDLRPPSYTARRENLHSVNIKPLRTTQFVSPRGRAVPYARRRPASRTIVFASHLEHGTARFTADPRFRQRLVKGSILQCMGAISGVVELEEWMFSNEEYVFVRAADHAARCTYTLGFAKDQVHLPTKMEELKRMEYAYQQKQGTNWYQQFSDDRLDDRLRG